MGFETGSDDDLLIQEVSRIVHRLSGIQLGSNQKSMVQFRLTKRMLDLGMSHPKIYLDYLKNHQEEESKELVSLLTTHHTYFFREFQHFEFLEQNLASIVSAARSRGRRELRFWSAACSYGQEAYSLCMFLNHHLPKIDPQFTYSILGTDVDSQSVAISKNGVYRWDEVKEIPSLYLEGSWVRGTGEIKDFVKARDVLKKHCRFEPLNLLEVDRFHEAEPFDVIFCRNVFIYFDHETIKKITHGLMNRLQPYGFLAIGLSENLNGLDLPMDSVGPSVFQHQQVAKPSVSKKGTPVSAAPSISVVSSSKSAEGPISVFCIDDSPTVLTLLKKIFSEDSGFKVIGTGENGIDAAEKLKALKPDIVTLDIHMPKQNGIEYLEKNFRSSHPPVVIISSVSREDSALGLKALSLGASDYIEKPALQDLSEKMDEIRTKVRCVVRQKDSRSVGHQLEKTFEKKIKLKPDERFAKVILTSIGNLRTMNGYLQTLIGDQPALVLMTHGSDKLTHSLAKHLRVPVGLKLEIIEGNTIQLRPNTVYIADYKSHSDAIRSYLAPKKVSYMVFGDLPKYTLSFFNNLKGSQVFLEEISKGSSHYDELKRKAAYCVPVASLDYHANVYLVEEAS